MCLAAFWAADDDGSAPQVPQLLVRIADLERQLALSSGRAHASADVLIQHQQQQDNARLRQEMGSLEQALGTCFVFYARILWSWRRGIGVLGECVFLCLPIVLQCW